MENTKNQIISIHIQYPKGMTVYALGHSLNILNKAFTAFSSEYNIKLSDMEEESPVVRSVSDGSFVADVVVPISCTLLPILYDIIKRHFDSTPDYQVGIYQQKWSDEDNYQICKAVLEEYAVRKSDKPVNTFIDDIALPNPHKKESVRIKVQNTKYLMEESRITNTLSISGRDHCSKAHRIQFERACSDLKI